MRLPNEFGVAKNVHVIATAVLCFALHLAAGPLYAQNVPEKAATAMILSTGADGHQQVTAPPVGARSLTGAVDTRSGAPQLVSQISSDEAERVLIQLRGTPLARVAPAQQNTARQQLAALRQRAGDAVVQIASTVQGRSLARHEVLTHEYTHVFNGFAGRLSRAAQVQVRALADVQAVFPDVQAHTTSVEPDISLVRAPEFWTAYNYRGAGEVIAIIDTGIDYTHPDLGGCFGPGCKVVGGYDFVNSDADPADDFGHGTHVAAIAAGNGSLLGVAPDASLLSYKVCNFQGSCYSSNIIAGIDRAVDPNQDGNSADHAAVINMSLGGPGDPDDPMAQAVDNATAAGVLVAVAAGNSGPSFQSVGSPGAARTALTVGASENTDAIAYFSSRGPTANIYGLKPEIVAPGVGVCAAQGVGTALGSNCIDTTHVRLSGTSMATPHAAGAAALIRGLLPALSPGEAKSLLVQNAVDLGYEAFIQGAGRLDVLAAAQGKIAVAPATVSFGLDDLTLATWTSSRAVTVRNLDSATHSYTAATTSLPAGITATLAPSTFTLTAGASTTVTFSVSVNNAVVQNPPAPPYAYDTAELMLTTGSQQARVPFAFIKSPFLRLHFDQPPGLLLVHNRNTFAYATNATATTMDVLVPNDTYDILALFNNNTVVHEGVVLNDFADDTLNSSEANHRISFTLRNESDQVIAGRLAVSTIRHKTSDMGFTTLWFGAPSPTMVSTIDSAYEISMGVENLSGTTEYVAANGLRSGVAADYDLGNHAADLTLGHLTYHMDPAQSSIKLIDYVGTMFSSGGAFAAGYYDLWSGFAQQLYTTRVPYQPFFLFTYKQVLDPGSNTFLHQTGYLQGGPTAGAIAAFDYQAFGLTLASQAAYTTTTGDLPVRLGPPVWTRRFQNSSAAVALSFPLGDWCLSFHDQGGDAPYAPAGVPFSLTAGSVSVASGVLSQSAANCAFDAAISMPVSPGLYQLSAGPLPYMVGGLGGITQVTAQLATTASDPNPPWLTGLSLRGGGSLKDAVAPGTPLVIDLQVHDESIAAVEIAYRNGATEIPLPVTLVATDTYEATLGSCTPGAVDLIVTASDQAGNSVRQELSPGVACRALTCGNGVLDSGEVCDDGNTVSGDGCNAACTSNETCGNGVTDRSGEQCDDGNANPGDGCSAGCTVEAGWTCSGTFSVCSPLAPSPTPTRTASSTPTPSRTATRSATATPRHGPKATLTPTKTLAPTATATKTATPVSTNTPITTPTPAASPTAKRKTPRH